MQAGRSCGRDPRPGFDHHGRRHRETESVDVPRTAGRLRRIVNTLYDDASDGTSILQVRAYTSCISRRAGGIIELHVCTAT